ncbi:MAG: hypothetical protein Tsb009_02100 [Planctomycetaceae bacterium]
MKSRGRKFVWLLFCAFFAGLAYLWYQEHDAGPDEESASIPPLQRVVTTNNASPSEQLNVQLKPGQIFPLMKTVNEKVTQFTPSGPVESQMTLKVLLVIRVQEVLKDRTKLRVDYQRVQFSQNFPGNQIQYDSDTPPRTIPLEAQVYHGLAKNGFEFWIGRDHKVIEPVEGFQEFLKRCVQHVSPEQREAVMTQFVKSTGDDAIANFIDDSIGLLPNHNRKVQAGDTWTRKRQVLRPVPIYLSSNCTLKKIDSKIAEIVIDGRVIPSAAYGQTPNQKNAIQLSVVDGHLAGECRIRRETGLPEQSKIRRVFDMRVRLPNGHVVRQRKDSTTTITVYEPQGTPKSIATPNAGARRADQVSKLSPNDRSVR